MVLANGDRCNDITARLLFRFIYVLRVRPGGAPGLVAVMGALIQSLFAHEREQDFSALWPSVMTLYAAAVGSIQPI
jgi:hypothetical protein